ncbi:MAG TPA: TolC family protein [Candidatus Dormibacteraeota bacterium]|nr:TolC family protein [Candidatus Dormibacteraeota bacterium]
MRSLRQSLLRFCKCLPLGLFLVVSLYAQENTATSPANPVRLTLEDALQRARRNSVPYQGAVTDAGIAHEDKKQAVAGLLPNVNYNNSAIYTQGNGAGNNVRFIANNAVHEYISQGNVHEALDVAGFAEARRASAAAAAAKARAEIASRGLVVTVVQSYFAVAAAERKLETAQKAADEGERFMKLTQDLEHGGEVAHSDVIKSELQVNDRRRQLQEAKLAALNTRLDLAVLLFPDFNDNFELAEDLHTILPLPAFSEVEARAAHENPDIRAALETVKAEGNSVLAARSGYLPSLSLDYFYGIDATHFATRTDGISNLGSSAVATLNLPIWNWGATQSKIKQAELKRDQAKRELSFAQRKLIAELKSLYAEAQTAADELSNLQRSAELGAESLRLITLRYKNGESTVLEVVDAQNTATVSDAAYQDGAVRYRVALANLQTLTGVLTTP